MRKELIFGGMTSVLVLFAAVYFIGEYRGMQRAVSALPGGATPSVAGSAEKAPAGGEKTLTLAEVARHATPSDCFIVINGRVFDVTNYLSIHPGGANRITPFCGADATTAFMTKGGEGIHSPTAYRMLEGLLKGPIGALLSEGDLVPSPGVSSAPVASSNPSREAASTAPAPITMQLTLTEVARHGSPADCYVVVRGTVYNLTSFIAQHPGGQNPIVSSCGNDATPLFDSKHGQQQLAVLAAYALGALNATVHVSAPVAKPAAGIATSPQATQNPRENDDDAWDD